MSAKKISVLLLICLLIITMVPILGCQSTDPDPVVNGDADDDGFDAIKPQTISFVAAIPMSGVNVIIADMIKDNIEEYTEGKILLEFYFGGVLGGEMQHLEMLRDGEIELALGFIHDTRWAEEYAAQYIPFLFPSFDAVREYLHHPYIKENRGNALAEGGNMIYLDTWSCGPRRITSNKKFTNVAEMEGLRIRMPEIPLWIRVYRFLNTDPTPIPAPEIFEALQAGIIEAQENWISNIHGRRMDEVQKYLTTSDHQYQTFDVLANKDWFEGLHPRLQDAVQRAVTDACLALPPYVDEENERLVAELIERGMELVEIDGSEFREAAWEEMMRMGAEILDPKAWEIAQEIVSKHSN